MSSLFQNLDFNESPFSQRKQPLRSPIVRETFVFFSNSSFSTSKATQGVLFHFTRAFHCGRSMTIYRGKLETCTNSLSPPRKYEDRSHIEMKWRNTSLPLQIESHPMFCFTTCVACIFLNGLSSLVVGQNFSFAILINRLRIFMNFAFSWKSIYYRV